MSAKTTPSILAARTSKSVSRRRSGVGRTSRPGRLFRTRLRNAPPMTRISADLHQPVTPLPVIANKRHGAAKIVLGGRVRNEAGGFIARDLQDVGVAQDVTDL